MTTLPMRLTAANIPDGLVLLLAIKTAAILVIPLGPGFLLGHEVVAWAGLATVYAGCAWACGTALHVPVWLEPFARAGLLFCVLLGVCLWRHFGELSQPSPLHFVDWLVLVVCCACSALIERPACGD